MVVKLLSLDHVILKKRNSWSTKAICDHSHKKQKDSLETQAACSWNLILTWNFGGGQGDSASAFFKIASASWLWCSENYNWLFICQITIILEAQVFQRQLRRSLKMKKIIANAPLCVLLCTASYSIQRADKHIAS